MRCGLYPGCAEAQARERREGGGGVNAETIAVLLAKGLSGADILDVARAMEATKDATAAERKRRQRANAKAEKNGECHGVTVTRDTPPNDIDILTPLVPLVISDEITPPAENDDVPEVKPEHVLEAYNVVAERVGLSKARMTPERRKRLAGFVKRHPADDITEAIHALETSPFLRGDNDRGWKADFDFLLQPKSFTKLIEGTYGR